MRQLSRLDLAACVAALLSGAVASQESTCDSDGVGCSSDLVSALQLGRRGDKVSQRSDKSKSIWRDASEQDKQAFAQLKALRGGEEPTYHAPNAQADPGNPDPPKGWAQWDIFTKQYNWTKQAVRSPNPCTKVPGWDPPSEPLRDIPEISSQNGRLETTLTIEPAWIEVPFTGIRVMSRLYNGMYPGPTIRVKRGDHVIIHVENKLGPNAPDEARWLHREGMGTNEFPGGFPEDHPQYQYVGQSDGEPNKMKGVMNNMHKVNTTNLHVHGWHVSSHQPQDEVVLTEIKPGENYTYEYFLSPYHSSGNSWYHDHWHGTTTSQTNGGLVGALIIDEDEGEVPQWVVRARDVMAVIHEADFSYFGPSYVKYFPDDPYAGCFPFGSVFSLQCALGHRSGLVANLSGDLLYRMEYLDGYGYGVNQTIPMTSFLSVNGQFRPYIDVMTGEWVRLRFIYASGNIPLHIVFNESGCEMQLISKDSVLLHDLPRKLEKGVYMGAGNRAQVMIRCNRPGTFDLKTNLTEAFSVLALNDILRVKVAGDSSNAAAPQPFTVSRPRYLQSLLDVKKKDLYKPKVPNRGKPINWFNGRNLAFRGRPAGAANILDGKTLISQMTFDFPAGRAGRFPQPPTGYTKQPIRFVVNNMTFNDTVPMASFEVGEIVELELLGVGGHSWHMHVDPVQFHEFKGMSDKEVEDTWGGYFRRGDWQDVVQIPGFRSGVKVRFQTDCYTGALVVHCHVLYHEDLGMMTWYNVTGRDLTTNPRFKNDGIFASPPKQCMKDGQRCAPPQCTDYSYGLSGNRPEPLEGVPLDRF